MDLFSANAADNDDEAAPKECKARYFNERAESVQVKEKRKLRVLVTKILGFWCLSRRGRQYFGFVEPPNNTSNREVQ